MLKMLKDYFDLQNKIHKYFHYQEDWVTIPLSDETHCHWMIVGGEDYGTVVRSPEPFTEQSIRAGKVIYGGPIYTQRHLPKWVYREPDFTAICVDTQCDGNKYLMVFDNAKECKDQNLKQLYRECW